MAVVTDTTYTYPEEIKEAFIRTDGITFADGTVASSAEIWNFMTEDAPRRFPHLFSLRNNNGIRGGDVSFFSGIKQRYLRLSLKDRLMRAHEKGVPIIMVQGGQFMDLYYAAGGIPLRPGMINM